MAPGTEAVFQIEATGDDLQFHWQKECVYIADGDGYRGTNIDTLRILDVEKTHKGRYRCRVKNYVEGKQSNEALLTVSKLFITVTIMLLIMSLANSRSVRKVTTFAIAYCGFFITLFPLSDPSPLS